MRNRTRRFVMLGGLGAGSIAFGYGFTMATCNIAHSRLSFLRPLFQVIPSLKSPAAIGHAWLDRESVECATEALLSNPALGPLCFANEDPKIIEKISHAIQEEFQQGEVEEVERWLVSLSEVRIAAVWVLSRETSFDL